MQSRAWVGTIGRGLWSSADLDEWTPATGGAPDAAIFSLVRGGDALYAGGRGVVHRHGGGRWTSAALPDGALEPWSLAIDPAAPEVVLAGCRPFALLCSEDAGEHWSALALELPAETERPHTPRVTAILIGDGAIWCGAEVGGVFRSEDRGKTWAAMSDGLPSLDIHALAFAESRRDADAPLLAATNRGLARWDVRWTPATLHAPWRYCRALATVEERHGFEERPGFAGALPSGRGLGGPSRPPFLCGLGDGPPGTRGGVVLSQDGGRVWQSALFPGTAASTVWSIAVAGEDALAAAIGGEMFASEDGGRSWRRLAQTFDDQVRAVLIT